MSEPTKRPPSCAEALGSAAAWVKRARDAMSDCIDVLEKHDVQSAQGHQYTVDEVRYVESVLKPYAILFVKAGVSVVRATGALCGTFDVVPEELLEGDGGPEVIPFGG